MTKPPDIDFARDRSLRRRWRTIVLGLLIVVFSLQLGLLAWRFQAGKGVFAQLDSQRQKLLHKTERLDNVGLSAEQSKAAASVQTMLKSLGTPWELLLTDIERARTKRVTIEAIQPSNEDGSVRISISCADYSGVAEFIDRLSKQELLYDVMLVSEAKADNAVGGLRAVISANWRSAL